MGMFEAVLRACFATIVSRLVFLSGLIFLRKNYFFLNFNISFLKRYFVVSIYP